METKTFYAVEYSSCNERQTYDIFSTLKEVRKFIQELITFGNGYKALAIFKADFKNTFQEDGKWNYDDYSDTIYKYHKYHKNLI